jgi:predicted MPP superfamily phosphohydrolase
MINKENPDIIFIAWDLFDWQDAKGATYFKDSINKLKFSDWIFLVEWNHDTYFWEDNVYDMLEWTNITLLKNEFTNVDWLQIIWLDYSTNRDKTLSDLNALTSKWYDKNLPSILIFHEPILTEEFKNFGINLQLSGHTHNWQIWPFNYIVRIIFKGKEYWLFKEWDYNIYTTNGVWTWGPPMRMFNIPEVVVLKFN